MSLSQRDRSGKNGEPWTSSSLSPQRSTPMTGMTGMTGDFPFVTNSVMANPSFLPLPQSVSIHSITPPQNPSLSRENLEQSNQVHLPRFKWVDGRGFKENGNPNYLLPNDNEEIDRMALDHYNLRYAFQTNFHAPVRELLEQGVSVLDVGCGAAWWLKEMANDFPNSNFTGVDLLPYPVLELPRNVNIHIADATKLPFPDNTFDFVYQRNACMGYTSEQWRDVVNECIRVTKPRGWVEFVERDGHCWDAGPRTTMLYGKLGIALGVRGIHFRYAKKLGELFQSTPLADVIYEYRSIPLGWFGRVGELNLQVMEQFLRALRPMVGAEIAHNKKEAYDLLVKDFVSECKSYRSWMNVHFVFGRKLGPGEEPEPEPATETRE